MIKDVIRRFALEVEYDSDEKAYEFQSELLSIVKEKLVTVIEETISLFNSEGKIIRINKLEIDLGNFFVEDINDKLFKLFEGKLKEELSLKCSIAGPGNINHQGVEFVNLSVDNLENLKLFLETGTIKWSALSERENFFNVRHLFQECLFECPDLLKGLLVKTLQTSRPLSRFVRQFDDENLRSTLALLSPYCSADYWGFYKELLLLFKYRKFVKNSLSEFREFIWMFLFKRILLNRNVENTFSDFISYAVINSNEQEGEVLGKIIEAFYESESTEPFNFFDRGLILKVAADKGICVLESEKDIQIASRKGVEKFLGANGAFVFPDLVKLVKEFKSVFKKVKSYSYQKPESEIWNVVGKLFSENKRASISKNELYQKVVEVISETLSISIEQVVENCTLTESDKRELLGPFNHFSENFNSPSKKETVAEVLEKKQFLSKVFKELYLEKIIARPEKYKREVLKAELVVRELIVQEPKILKQVLAESELFTRGLGPNYIELFSKDVYSYLIDAYSSLSQNQGTKETSNNRPEGNGAYINVRAEKQELKKVEDKKHYGVEFRKERELLISFFRTAPYYLNSNHPVLSLWEKAEEAILYFSEINPVLLRNIILEAGFNYQSLPSQRVIGTFAGPVQSSIIKNGFCISLKEYQDLKIVTLKKVVKKFWVTGRIPYSDTYSEKLFAEAFLAYYDFPKKEIISLASSHLNFDDIKQRLFLLTKIVPQQSVIRVFVWEFGRENSEGVVEVEDELKELLKSFSSEDLGKGIFFINDSSDIKINSNHSLNSKRKGFESGEDNKSVYSSTLLQWFRVFPKKKVASLSQIDNPESFIVLINCFLMHSLLPENVIFNFQELFTLFLNKYKAFAIRFAIGLKAREFAVLKKTLPETLTKVLETERRVFAKVANDKGVNLSEDYFEDSTIESSAIIKLSDADPAYINNSGLILLHPFLSRFFKILNLLDGKGKSFKDDDAIHRAVHLLQYLANKGLQAEEHELILNKLLCGMPLETPVFKNIELTDEEIETCESLLEGVIQNWSILKNTTPDNLRGSFLIRNGKLTEEEKGFRLRVEEKGYDVLVEKIPWSVGMVRLPWMDKVLYVDWK